MEKKREERKIQEQQKMEEKAKMPKKPVKRREVWEVEAIKGIRNVGGKKFYLVKFENWGKPQWEPEENVQVKENVFGFSLGTGFHCTNCSTVNPIYYMDIPVVYIIETEIKTVFNFLGLRQSYQ